MRHRLIVSLTASFFVGPDMTYSDPDQIMRVAQKHPKMKIVVPHACWPHVTKALALSMLCPNVYLCPDLYVHIKDVPQADEFAYAANHILKYCIIKSCFQSQRCPERCYPFYIFLFLFFSNNKFHHLQKML